MNINIWNDLKMNRYFECEIKITSRCQKVTVNKWVIATEPNHLTVDSLRNESTCSETQKKKNVLAKWSKNRQYGV